MRKTLFVCFWLASGCASAPVHFAPMANCRPSMVDPSKFVCVDAAGAPYLLPWEDASGLVCFRADQFKTYNESCHAK